MSRNRTVGWQFYRADSGSGDDSARPRAIRLRQALEALGPIFVKFGQVLSTRRDLLPLDIADELARLQDRVQPFPAKEVLAQIEAAYGRPADEVFAEFDATPVASASVAQVHFARLRPEDGGQEVAVDFATERCAKSLPTTWLCSRHPGRTARNNLVRCEATEAREVVAGYTSWRTD